MHQVWKDYIDRLSASLLEESRKASLFEHKGLIGEVRESFVKEFLSQFLPEVFGIGKGELFDREGKRSPQMDVVIYDKSFPIPNIGGIRLFPIDSVVAVIEVKSNLNAHTLIDDMMKCAQVCAMGVRAIRPYLKEVKQEENGPKPTKEDWDFLYPGTYIIGYSGYKENGKELVETAARWVKSSKIKLASFRLCMPRVVATPTAVMLRSLDNFNIESDTTSVGEDEFTIAGCKCEFSFNIFVADLMTKILSRTHGLRMNLIQNDCTYQAWILSVADQFQIDELIQGYKSDWLLCQISPQ